MSSPNTYTEVKLLYCPYQVFLTIFHSHDFNKEESKTALYGTKITVPECRVCSAANHANAVTPLSLPQLAAYTHKHTHTLHHPKHTHAHKNTHTHTQKTITDIHTEVTATTVYTVLR